MAAEALVRQHAGMTFNPGAIPVAVLMLVFAYLVGTRREKMIDRYYRRRGKERSGFGYRFQMRYAIFMSVAAVVLAACALFVDFDKN